MSRSSVSGHSPWTVPGTVPLALLSDGAPWYGVRVTLPVVRLLRISVVFAGAFGALYVRFAMGLFRENEATRVIHFAMFAVGGLLAFGAAAFELGGDSSVARRDALWGLSGGILMFASLRLFGLV